MGSRSGQLKMTGTLLDIVKIRDQEIAKKEKEKKQHNIKRQKDENKSTKDIKKSTRECYWKTKVEHSTTPPPQTLNNWNLPFKPFVVHPAREINASYDRNIKYKLTPHKIENKIDYSSVKRQVGVMDPRLQKVMKTSDSFRNMPFSIKNF